MSWWLYIRIKHREELIESQLQCKTGNRQDKWGGDDI